MRIRIRAEQKCGQLLKDTPEVRKGRRSKQMSSGTTFKTLTDMGISRDQSSKFQKLAEQKCGKLLKETEKAKASRGNQHTGKLDPSCDTTGPKTLYVD